MSENPGSSSEKQQHGTSDIEELNDEGVGGTLGAKDTFEPEETEDPDAEPDAGPDAGRA